MSDLPQPAYNTCAQQRDAILRRLSQGPATVADLMDDCHSPDPRKRISELRRSGHAIDSREIELHNVDGTVNRVQAYELLASDVRQCELDLLP